MEFPEMIVSDAVPEGTLMLVPPVTLTDFYDSEGKYKKTVMEFNAKGCFVISGIKTTQGAE